MNLEEAILCWLPALQEHSSSELELVCNLSRAEWSFWRPHHEEILPRVPLDLQMGIHNTYTHMHYPREGTGPIARAQVVVSGVCLPRSQATDSAKVSETVFAGEPVVQS